MTKLTRRWINQTKLPDGHRLFQAVEPYEDKYVGLDKLSAKLLLDVRGMWAMADDSGDYPDHTDDGVLWLDFGRDLGAGAPRTHNHDAVTPGIPLFDANGDPCSTITDACTMLVLAFKFDWHINCMGTLVRAAKL